MRRRKYQMRRRLEDIERTRDRITRAAFELHATVGPARTSISGVAERAGVQRHTVYRHFPTTVDLIRACTEHGLSVTGPPDPADWRAIEDQTKRLGVALGQLYAYFRANERMLGNIFRDMPIMPELVEGSAAFAERFGELYAALTEPLIDGQRSASIGAAVGHAMDFTTWRSLTAKGLTDEQARDVMVTFVRAIDASAGATASGAPASQPLSPPAED